MDKKMNDNIMDCNKKEKGMSRTEFAQEYSIETGKQNCNKAQKPCKSNKKSK